MGTSSPIISLMLAVPDTPTAVEWYRQALGAQLLWSLGSVAGLEIEGAPFFLHEPVAESFASPQEIRTTTVRVELFVDGDRTGGGRRRKRSRCCRTHGSLGDPPAGRLHRSFRP